MHIESYMDDRMMDKHIRNDLWHESAWLDQVQ